ncbi:hypothetical protein F4775DRAFT_594940 [Biscogniauxia sp. FL1348]|nr:hypothetical protein F4775DRAFT_594940 [Biscogniauxia sp. FL1348]
MPPREAPPNPSRQATSYHPLSNAPSIGGANTAAPAPEQSIAAPSPPQSHDPPQGPQPPPPSSSSTSISQNTQQLPCPSPAYQHQRPPTPCPLPPYGPTTYRVGQLAGQMNQPPQPRKTTFRFSDAVEVDVEEVRRAGSSMRLSSIQWVDNGTGLRPWLKEMGKREHVKSIA